jgi:hypothetical protein
MMPPIFATLRASGAVVAIVGSNPARIYRHGVVQQGTPAPYIAWSVIGSAPENNLSDPPPADRIAVQVDCYHTTDQGVVDLATAVRDAIEQYAHMTGTVVDERERETNLYRMSLQFDYWLGR